MCSFTCTSNSNSNRDGRIRKEREGKGRKGEEREGKGRKGEERERKGGKGKEKGGSNEQINGVDFSSFFSAPFSSVLFFYFFSSSSHFFAVSPNSDWCVCVCV